MDNKFETKFSELQADMIAICLEYCERKATEIFVHVIYERDSIFTNFFFRMKEEMYKKGMLGDGIGKVSFPRQKEALSIITNNYKELIFLCQNNSRPIPTEMRLVYDVRKGSLRANYSYDAITTNEKTARDVTEAWFELNRVHK